MSNARTIGEVIREQRMKKGLGQPALAKLSGVSQQTISATERTAFDPTFTTVCKLADALGMSLNVLRKRLRNG